MKLRTKIYVVLVGCVAVLYVFGQAPSYYHDTSLDSINANLIVIDGDLQNLSGGGNTNRGITITDQNTNAAYMMNFYSTNTAGYLTNGVGTNKSAFNAARSNLIGSYSVAFSNTWKTNLDGAVSGSNASYQISCGSLAGTTFTMDLGANFFNSYLPVFAQVGRNLRVIILAIFSLITMVWEIDYCLTAAKEIFNTKQTKGSSQAILGTNASLAVGITYAAVITGLIVAAVGFCASYFLTGPGHSQVASVMTLRENVENFGNQFSLWTLITTFLPIYGIMAIFFNYLLFRYVLTYPVFMVVHDVVLFFIA